MNSSSHSNEDPARPNREKSIIPIVMHHQQSKGRPRKHPLVHAKYLCSICQQPCSKPSILRKHLRAHTDERPFPCDTCGIQFKTVSNLNKHQKSRSHLTSLEAQSYTSATTVEPPSGDASPETLTAAITSAAAAAAGSDQAVVDNKLQAVLHIYLRDKSEQPQLVKLDYHLSPGQVKSLLLSHSKHKQAGGQKMIDVLKDALPQQQMPIRESSGDELAEAAQTMLALSRSRLCNGTAFPLVQHSTVSTMTETGDEANRPKKDEPTRADVQQMIQRKLLLDSQKQTLLTSQQASNNKCKVNSKPMARSFSHAGAISHSRASSSSANSSPLPGDKDNIWLHTGWATTMKPTAGMQQQSPIANQNHSSDILALTNCNNKHADASQQQPVGVPPKKRKILEEEQFPNLHQSDKDIQTANSNKTLIDELQKNASMLLRLIPATNVLQATTCKDVLQTQGQTGSSAAPGNVIVLTAAAPASSSSVASGVNANSYLLLPQTGLDQGVQQTTAQPTIITTSNGPFRLLLAANPTSSPPLLESPRNVSPNAILGKSASHCLQCDRHFKSTGDLKKHKQSKVHCDKSSTHQSLAEQQLVISNNNNNGFYIQQQPQAHPQDVAINLIKRSMASPRSSDEAPSSLQSLVIVDDDDEDEEENYQQQQHVAAPEEKINYISPVCQPPTVVNSAMLMARPRPLPDQQQMPQAYLLSNGPFKPMVSDRDLLRAFGVNDDEDMTATDHEEIDAKAIISDSQLRTFVCETCHKGFRTQGILLKHIRSKAHRDQELKHRQQVGHQQSPILQST